jgi:integrase/recombinase XerD
MLVDPADGLFRADERVFTAMLDGWRAQMLARGLTTETIKQRCQLLERFQEFTGEFPWQWRPADVDDFLAGLRSGENPISLKTLRSYSNAVAKFCSYLTHPGYGWGEFCQPTFGDIPSQICFEWNTPRHTTDDAVPAQRRAFTKAELQRLFDYIDDLVDREYAAGSKRWLPLFRDSVAFKVCYAYGLPCREMTMLDLEDFGPNPHVTDYGPVGPSRCGLPKARQVPGPGDAPF